MKNHPQNFPGTPDPDFDGLLRRSGGGVRLPSSFDHEVWRRIETAEDTAPGNPLARGLDAFLSALLRPAMAAAAIMIAAAGGLWLGSRVEPPGPEGKTAYVRAISPFAHGPAGGRE